MVLENYTTVMLRATKNQDFLKKLNFLKTDFFFENQPE